MFNPKVFFFLWLNCLVLAEDSVRLPLSYRPSPEGLYQPRKPAGSTSLLDYVNSRSDLSTLARILSESAGMAYILVLNVHTSVNLL